jgi:hypothetical protein
MGVKDAGKKIKKMSYQKLQANKAKSVTVSDTDNIELLTGRGNRGCVLFVGTGGDLRVLTEGGDDVVFKNVADGSFLPVQVVRVFSTNTTASDILALW